MRILIAQGRLRPVGMELLETGITMDINNSNLLVVTVLRLQVKSVMILNLTV